MHNILLAPGKGPSDQAGWVATCGQLSGFGTTKSVALHHLGDQIEWTEHAAALKAAEPAKAAPATMPAGFDPANSITTPTAEPAPYFKPVTP